MLRVFLAEAPKTILRLREALAQRDAGALKRTAYELKGELRYLQIPELSKRVGELEDLAGQRDLQRSAILFAKLETEIAAVLTSARSMTSA